MAERENLIPIESVGALFAEIENASSVDQLTFYAHDILAGHLPGKAKFKGFLGGVARLLQQNIDVGGESYMLQVRESGLPAPYGASYQEISVERKPLIQPRRGKYRVDTARWAVDGRLDAEWVGYRADGTDWIGRPKQGDHHEVSYTDVLAKSPWVKESLLAVKKMQKGGFDG